MARSTTITRPPAPSLPLLLHWVNTLPPPSCLLVSHPSDLLDGEVLLDIITTSFLPSSSSHPPSSFAAAWARLLHTYPSLFVGKEKEEEGRRLPQRIVEGTSSSYPPTHPPTQFTHPPNHPPTHHL